MSTSFHDDFLAELKAMDDFLVRRTGNAALVRREDPDVRRLMESIAFFSARTRQAASDQLRRSVLQLARGHLDDFLSPQPARGLVQAVPDGLTTDSAPLPAGTRLRLTTADGDLGLFSTMVDATLRPLEIDRAKQQLRGDGGCRLLIRIRARRAVEDIAEPLAIYVSYRDDYQRSQYFLHQLRHHLRKGGVSVVYSSEPETSQVGAWCHHSFGSAPSAHAPPGSHGRIDQIRTFFHFPAKELYLNVSLARAPTPWRQAWLCLDLDDDWPRDLVVTRDVFRLFVIPIENLVEDDAVPIKCDGTRSHFPIAPVRGDAGLALHSVIGVFQETPAGRERILPIQLASGDSSYDLALTGDDVDEIEPQLVVRMPDAFAAPRLISVRARWHQPGFDNVAVGKLEVELQTQHIVGVKLQALGLLTPHRQSALWRDPAAMLQMLSRRSSRELLRRELISLMTVLGADQDSYHAGIDDLLLYVKTHEEPADLHGGGGIRQVYEITIGDVGDDRRGLVEDYLSCIGALLDAWRSNPVRLARHWLTSGARQLPMIGSGR